MPLCGTCRHVDMTGKATHCQHCRFGAHQYPGYLSLAFFQVLKSYSEKSTIEKLLEANAFAGLTTMIAVGFTAWRHILSF